MPSWDQMLGALRSRLGFGATSASHAEPAPPVEPSASPVDGWRDVPRLQRTLAEPIAPVAINDGFRDSLAAFADPRFLAPLSHQVDPSVGGLVAGLVAPGEPRMQPGPELVVPHRPAGGPAPRVQRLATWPDPTLATVPLEFPLASVPAPADERPAEVDVPVPASPEVPAEAGVAAPAASVEPVVHPSVGDEASPLDVPAVPAVVPEPPVSAPGVAALPVAAPTGRTSAGASPNVQRFPRSAEPGERPEARPTHDAPLAPEPPAQPAVPERLAEALPEAATSEQAQAPAIPAVHEPAVQRSVETETPLAELDLVQPEPAPSDPAAVLELPVSRPAADRPVVPAPGAPQSDRPTPAHLQRSAAPVGDVPTLGPRLAAAAASAAVREPLLAPRPDDVPVQRVTYLRDEPGPRPGPVPRAPQVTQAARPDAPAARTPGPVVPAVQPLRELPTISRLAAPTGRSVPPTLTHLGDPVRPVAAPGGSSGPGGRDDGARVEVGAGVEVAVSRLVDPEEAAVPAEPPGFTEVPLRVLGGFGPADDVHPSELDGPDAGASGSASAETPAPSAAEELLGPAVTLEPWTSPAPAQSESAAPRVPSAQVASPITAVQRRAVPAPDAVRPGAPSVQRDVAAPARTVPQPPLVVAARPSSGPDPEYGPRPGQGMSFERMFAGVAATASVESPDAPVALQRQPSAEPAPSVDAASAPSTATSAAPAVSAAPGPDAASTANLDEMARRLYEPLAARLREELWLDRERAGLMTDV